MAREGERKTILQVYVANISAHEFLLGKVIAFMVVALAECVLLLVFLFVFFGVRLAGDPTEADKMLPEVQGSCAPLVAARTFARTLRKTSSRLSPGRPISSTSARRVCGPREFARRT